MTDKTLLTTKQAADYLGVSSRALGARWSKWGLTPHRVGKRNMYRVAELEQYLADNVISKPQAVNL
jgi:Zn-dependent peptidase ImmA (M78 family)